MNNEADIITLPCSEREFTRRIVRLIEETNEPHFAYAYLLPNNERVYPLKTMRLLFNYLEERFGDKPETAELIERLKAGSSFYWKNEGDRDELVKRHPESFEDGCRIDIEVATRNLLDIKRILDKAGIKFWLMFGTFLGAYRDASIIPWDEDTDLAIYLEDVPRLLNCRDEITKVRFEFASDPIMTTIYRDGEHTDLYSFSLYGSERIWLKFRYPADDFETLNTIRFLGTDWRILNNPEKWLTYTYGKDWRIPIVGKKATDHPFGEADL